MQSERNDMNGAAMGTQPPAWAQTLLALILDPTDHDAIAGDLLEQFRDEEVPARGLARARRWYSAQVAGYLWRSSWRWAAALVAFWVLQDVFNSFRRPDGTLFIQTYPQAPFWQPMVCAAAGFVAARRARSVVAGALTACCVQGAALAGMALWWNATFYPFAQVMQHNPYWIGAWHYSGAGQSFAVWAFYDNIGAVVMATIVLMPAAALFGSVGGFAGKLTRSQP